MPLLNTTGALKQQRGTSVIPLPDNQWISQLNGVSFSIGEVAVDSYGYTYVMTPGTQGITKVDPNGALVSTFNTSSVNTYTIVYVDTFGNMYASGNITSSGSKANIIKYDSAGNILWQKFFNLALNVNAIQVSSSNDLFVLVSSGGGTGTYIVFKLDPSTGAIVNQRKLLKQATSGPSDLLIDNSNGNLIVAGTDYQTRSEILIGTYNFTNTDTASNMLYQSSTVDSYETFAGGANNQSIVTDGTYIYQVAYRVISGVTRSVFMKIDRSTGAVSYSNSIVISGNSLQLGGITIDNNGYIYVVGNYSVGTGQTIITKINSSTGTIVWAKRFGNGTTSTNNIITGPTWSRGSIYFTAQVTIYSPSIADYWAIIKLKDDGSVANGTYGGHWIITTPTTSLVSYMPQATGTTTGANSTTVNTVTTSALTKTTSSITSTTYSL